MNAPARARTVLVLALALFAFASAQAPAWTGNTPADWTRARITTAIINGIDVTAPDANGRTGLHRAAQLTRRGVGAGSPVLQGGEG